MAIHVLQPGSSIEHQRDDIGNILVTVTIPPGQPGEGVYAAAGAALSDDALEAMALAAQPGCQIEIDVNGPSLQSIAIVVTL
jgi:hypothetical protein